MSFVTTIDTLQFSKRMQKAGFDKRAAEELAEAFKDAQSQSFENVATKQNISDLSNETKQGISDLRNETKHEISELRKDMQLLEHRVIIKLGSLTALGVAILAALIKL